MSCDLWKVSLYRGLSVLYLSAVNLSNRDRESEETAADLLDFVERQQINEKVLKTKKEIWKKDC